MTKPSDKQDLLSRNPSTLQGIGNQAPPDILHDAEAVRIDFSQVKTALEMPSPDRSPAKKYQVDVAHETTQTVDEIAQDTVELLTRVQGLEDTQKAMLAQLNGIDQLLRGLTHQGETTRRELLSERKASAVRSVFLAIAPVLDALEGMSAGLDPLKDAVVQSQLRGVNSALRSIVQSLGYEPFQPEIGASFDPTEMECAGFAEGAPGVVLAAVRTGYRAGTIVARCAGVKIAAPQTPVTTISSPELF
jgi:molecular chaperone GrpE (heat shock protein)